MESNIENLCWKCIKWDTAERIEGINLPFYHCVEDDGKHYNTMSCEKFVQFSIESSKD